MNSQVQDPITRPRPATPADCDEGCELTILMPCLNEAETVGACVSKARRYLSEAGISGEVLVADNGSVDGSQALAEAAGARVVDVPAKGYGAALMGGIAAARGRYVVMGDADDSYDFSRLDNFLEHLRQGGDLVMGNRFKGGIARGAMPFLHRYLGNPVLSYLGRLFFHVPIGDFHCGLRGFSRRAIAELRLRQTGMEFASEMVVKAKLAGLQIIETPTTLSPDGRSRPAHLRTWRDGWRHLRFLLLHSPRWLFMIPGLALIAVGLTGGLVLSGGQVEVRPDIHLGIHSFIACCFAVLIGGQLVMFSALATQFATTEGILPPGPKGRGFLLGIKLETILMAAAGVFVLGVAGFGLAVFSWASRGFGPIHYDSIMRLLAASMTAIAMGVQVAASGFLSSVLTLRR